MKRSISILFRGGLRLAESRAGAVDARRKGGSIVNGDVGEHLAVEHGAAGFEAGDELRLRHAVDAGSGVDASDPELAELTFAILAAGECGVQALFDLLLRDPVTARL